MEKERSGRTPVRDPAVTTGARDRSKERAEDGSEDQDEEGALRESAQPAQADLAEEDSEMHAGRRQRHPEGAVGLHKGGSCQRGISANEHERGTHSGKDRTHITVGYPPDRPGAKVGPRTHQHHPPKLKNTMYDVPRVP